MQRNVELLQRTMQYIKDHPERHKQSRFITECGTAACYAGWAALLSGWSVQRILSGPMYYEGAELLGLTHWEAETLFDSGNTVPMLELMVKDLVNGDKLRGIVDYEIEAKHVPEM
jgi:hypothetical protein